MLVDVLFAIVVLILLWDAIGLANRWYNLKKYGFTISPGLMMWQTKRGLNFIDRVAGISKRGWRAYGTLAAGVGIFAMVFIFVILVYNLIFLFTHPAIRIPGVVLVYPGLIPWLPVIPWIISIAAILLVHEFSHGLLLRAQNLQTKSVGGFVVVVLFGAFVEPNEKQLARAPVSKRLRMYAAGSMANFVLGFVCLALLLVLLVPKPGVYLYAVPENYAENFTLGSRIYQLDNVPINTLDDYDNFFENKQPYDNVWVVTENENVRVTLAKDQENENRGISGLWPVSAASRWNFVNPLFSLGAGMGEILGYPVFHPHVFDTLVPWAVIDVLKWMFALNWGVGLFNMLPAVPFDGGYMMQAILERRTSSEKAKRVVRTLSYLILVLVLMSILPAFLR
jgi:membrane-associated protease RseP (regulator of RpoE activity)